MNFTEENITDLVTEILNRNANHQLLENMDSAELEDENILKINMKNGQSFNVTIEEQEQF